MAITEALTGAAASPQMQAAALGKISEATGFLATRDTPKRMAVNTFIEDVRASNLNPAEKAAVIWNAKKIVREYANQKDIVTAAIAKLTNSANPDGVDDSWLETFLDEARAVSDDDLKAIWAHLLAEELETPGAVPRQVIQIVKYMDKPDAKAFYALCSFSVHLVGDDDTDDLAPVIIGTEIESYYAHHGLSRDDLTSLKSRGLISMSEDTSLGGGYIWHMGCVTQAIYGEQAYDFPKDYQDIRSGAVALTRAGRALAGAFEHGCVPGFFEEKCIPFWERNIASGNDILEIGFPKR